MRLFKHLILASVFAMGLALPTQGQELLAPPKALVPPQVGHQYTRPPSIPASPPSDISTGDAQTVAPRQYTLDELLTLASENNPTLRQARLHISAELGKALQAGLYPNPTLSYEGEQIFLDIPGNNDSPGEFQGGVIEQRIVTAGKLRMSREKYLRRAHVTEHQAMVQQFRVCNDVRIHFYKTLATAETLSIRRELVKTADDAAVTAQESYNVGQARRPDVRRANVALQRARLDVLNAENRHHEMARRLTSLVGLPLGTVQVQGELVPQCPVLSYEEAASRLMAESPELAAARAKLAVDRATVNRESVEWIPDVVFRGGAGYNYEAQETTAVAGLSVEVPIFDRNQGTLRQARSDYARQQQEISRVEWMLRNRLATTHQKYVTALQHTLEYERVILPELKAA